MSATGCSTSTDVSVVESSPAVLRLPPVDQEHATPAAPPFRTAAPVACTYQLHCMTGVSRFYGVNLADGLVPSDDPAASTRALKAGEVDLAVVPASSSYVLDPEVVVLEDDRGVLIADHLVLLHRKELAGLYGSPLVRDLDVISQSLTADSIQWLYGEHRQRAPADAASWLATIEWPLAPPPRPGAPSLVVGTWGTIEQQLVAAVVVEHLERRGFEASLAPALPTRNAALDALAHGDIHVLPEYTASLLEHVNGAALEASADPVQTSARLAQYLVQIGAVLTRPSPATVSVAFLVRRPPKGAPTMGRLSDLRSVAQHITVHAHPTTAPVEPAKLTVPLRLTRSAALGGRGVEVWALQQRLVQLGFPVTPTGVFDDVTLGAVQAFQAARGMPVSTLVDERTQHALDRASPPGNRPPGAPVVYLTYDDGPDPRFTPPILDLLDRYQARATFFVLGVSVEEDPALTAMIVGRGHVLGNHTYRHPDLRRASTERVQTELRRTAELITAATGVASACMRPPYGAIDDDVRAVTGQFGLEPVLWDIDTEDWRGRGTSTIVRHALDVQPGAIVLLHDGGGDRADTVEATAQVLEGLSARGYRFESLPQC